MIFLAQGPRSTTTDIVVMTVAIAICVVLAFFVVVWWRRFDRKDQFVESRPRGFDHLYKLAQHNADEVAIAYPELPNPDVLIEFHTYTRAGVIGVRQDVHRQTLLALEALELIALLHSYNLRGCLVPYKGVLFVPVLSFFEARKMQLKIKAAMSQATAA